jgi:hypothetical protein
MFISSKRRNVLVEGKISSSLKMNWSILWILRDFFTNSNSLLGISHQPKKKRKTYPQAHFSARERGCYKGRKTKLIPKIR